MKTALGSNDLRSLPVRMVMTPVSKLIYVEPHEQALVAAQRLMEYEVDCLPVVNIINRDEEDHKELQIVGRISKRTLPVSL